MIEKSSHMKSLRLILSKHRPLPNYHLQQDSSSSSTALDQPPGLNQSRSDSGLGGSVARTRTKSTDEAMLSEAVGSGGDPDSHRSASPTSSSATPSSSSRRLLPHHHYSHNRPNGGASSSSHHRHLRKTSRSSSRVSDGAFSNDVRPFLYQLIVDFF